MMYGYDVKTLDDPVIEVGEKSLQLGVKLLMPGGSLLNFIPILCHVPPWVPGATSQKIAAEVKRLTLEMKRIPMDYVKKALVSVVSTCLFFWKIKSLKGHFRRWVVQHRHPSLLLSLRERL